MAGPSLDDVKRTVLKQMGYWVANMNEAEKLFWESLAGNSDTPDGSKVVRCKVGVSNQTANGSTSVFTINHGLNGTPIYANVTANNSNATGNKFVSWDATKITVTFDVAPASGSLLLEWVVLI